MFRSNIRKGKNVISVTLIMARLWLPDGLVGVLQKQLISWDFPVLQPVTQNGKGKNKKEKSIFTEHHVLQLEMPC